MMYPTSIVKVVQYEVGGRKFSSLKEAKRAETELAAVAELRHLLQDAINSVQTRCGNIDNVLTEILSEHQAVRDILVNYSKKLPRKKEKA